MKKTGYVVVDCTGIDLAAEEKVTVSGIYATVAAAFGTGKPIFFCNVENDGDLISSINVAGYVSSGDYVFSVNGATVTIDDEDGVTIS